MKKLFYILILLNINMCFAEDFHVDESLLNGIDHYFNELIPKYYNGQEDFSTEMNEFPLGIYMQGNGFSEVEGTKDLVFDFYYLVDNKRQDIQVIQFGKQIIGKTIYEYWHIGLTKLGIDFNYAYFVLTETECENGERKIIKISKNYEDQIYLREDFVINFPEVNLITLYQASIWIETQSFKNSKYYNMIVKWRKNNPYIRKMNFIEKIYYNKLKKLNY